MYENFKNLDIFILLVNIIYIWYEELDSASQLKTVSSSDHGVFFSITVKISIFLTPYQILEIKVLRLMILNKLHYPTGITYVSST